MAMYNPHPMTSRTPNLETSDESHLSCDNFLIRTNCRLNYQTRFLQLHMQLSRLFYVHH